MTTCRMLVICVSFLPDIIDRRAVRTAYLSLAGPSSIAGLQGKYIVLLFDKGHFTLLAKIPLFACMNSVFTIWKHTMKRFAKS